MSGTNAIFMFENINIALVSGHARNKRNYIQDSYNLLNSKKVKKVSNSEILNSL